MLQDIQHQGVIKAVYIIQKNDCGFLFLELMKGDLLQTLLQHWPLESNQINQWAREIVTTVSDLHRRGLAHLDVKLNNFLVDEDSSLKLTDFSSSIFIEGFKFRRGFSICGTVECLPPEYLFNKCRDDYDLRKIDAWSVGVTLYHLFTFRFPFGPYRGDFAKYVNDMLNIRKPFFTPSERETAPHFVEMVEGLLALDHRRRLTLEDALQSPHWSNS